jgi:hypothetical protein
LSTCNVSWVSLYVTSLEDGYFPNTKFFSTKNVGVKMVQYRFVCLFLKCFRNPL